MQETTRYFTTCGWIGGVLVCSLATGASAAITMSVVTPAAGDVFLPDSTVTIVWDSMNPTGDVTIYLQQGGVDHTLLGTASMAGGQMDWHIPPTLELGSDYRIRIVSYAIPIPFGGPLVATSGTFSIVDALPPPTMSVTAPAIGDTWFTGRVYTITWDAIAPSGNVDVYLHRPPNYRIGMLGSVPMADRSMYWSIPDTLPARTDYLIRLESNVAPVPVVATSSEFSVARPPILTVTSPTGGDVWCPGDPVTITWEATNLAAYPELSGSDVTVYLDKGGTLHTTIGTVPLLAKQIQWHVHGTIENRMDYEIRLVSTHIVVAAREPLVGTSDRFCISDSPPSSFIAITSPGNGDAMAAGDMATITWSVTNPNDYVEISVEKNGAAYSSIGYVPMAAERFDWDICPAFGNATGYRIKITGYDAAGTPTAGWSGSFSITNSLPKPALTVTYPAGGETWTAGVRANITWTSTDPSGGVYIDLLRDGQLYREIGYTPVTEGKFSWRPCTLIGNSSDYSIRLSTDACGPSVETTGGTFAIAGSSAPPTLTAVAPAVHTLWTGGATRQITWDHTNASGYVRLDLYRDGEWDRYIGYAPSDAGLFNWAIDSRIGNEAEYQIRMASPDICGGVTEAFGDLFGVRTCDLDRDQDVDLDDFESFVDCFNGPNRPPAPATLTLADCVGFDQDGDADVDLTDFAIFQGCFNGYNRAARCP